MVAPLKGHPESQDTRLLSLLLSSLIERKVEDAIPIDPDIARESIVQLLSQRNVQECKKLQLSCQKLLSHLRRKNTPEGDADVQHAMDDALTLLALERRKAAYVEQEICPQMFERALEQAKGDVYQFLIAERAEGRLRRSIPSMEHIRVDFRDDLNYLLEGHSPESAGDMAVASGIMTLRMPSSFAPDEEACTYHKAVHEDVHSVSIATAKRLGLDVRGNEGLRLMNEAVTELTAAAIYREHILRHKKPLKGQQLPNLSSLPYSEEIFATINSIMHYISFSDLQDAMLNRGGVRRLITKLDRQFPGEGRKKLLAFARTLRKLYLPASRRHIPEHWQTILPLEEYRHSIDSLLEHDGSDTD